MNPLTGASVSAPQRLYRDDSAALLAKDSVTRYTAYHARLDRAAWEVYRQLNITPVNPPAKGDLTNWRAYIPRARADWKEALQDRLDQLANTHTENIPKVADPIMGAAHTHGLLRATGLSVAAARIATFCDPGTATPETIRELFHTHRHAPTAAIVNLIHGDYAGATATAAGFDYDTRRIALLRLFANPIEETA